MRSIHHPGPVDPQRMQAVECHITHAAHDLPAGNSLLNALSHAVSGHGVRSAVCTLQGGAFADLGFVMPALSKHPEHAVYYSNRHLPATPVALESATATVGLRDGQPWFHCHGTWRDAHGTRMAGHVLPEQATIAEPIAASLCLVHGANFEIRHDAETGFHLFQPAPGSSGNTAGPRALAIQVRPNEDICQAIEAQCAALGVTRAHIRGGVGSLVGAEFEDGRTVEPFVTEVFIHEGRLAPDAHGTPRVRMDVSVVDYTGGLARGWLRHEGNPVLVTFELVLEPSPVV